MLEKSDRSLAKQLLNFVVRHSLSGSNQRENPMDGCLQRQQPQVLRSENFKIKYDLIYNYLSLTYNVFLLIFSKRNLAIIYRNDDSAINFILFMN